MAGRGYLFAAYSARIRIVSIDAPEPVIARMLRKLEVPDLIEAHAVEWVWREQV